MPEFKDAKRPPNQIAPSARYISGSDIAILLELLIEFRNVTQSRHTYARLTSMIVELGGADRLNPDTIP